MSRISRISGQTNATALEVRYLDPATVRDTGLIEQMAGWLDESETARLKRIVRPEHRHLFLVSHALLRKMLASELGCEPQEICFGFTGRQKPILALPASDKALHFNLAHTTGLTVIAIAAEPVGIDTESLTRTATVADLAKRYFTQTEYADILNQPEDQQQRRFLTYWTLKEAFLKAQAWGIVDSLDGFEFELGPPGHAMPGQIRLRIRNAKLTPTQPWRFHHWEVGNTHLVSLAVSARLDQWARPDLRAWSPDDWC